MNISIRRPQKEDQQDLEKLLTDVVSKSFIEQYGHDETYPPLQRETAKKIASLHKDYETYGKEEYFLIAETDKKIVGMIAYGKVSSRIRKYAPSISEEIPEIKNVYILPEYQGKGIGTSLFKAICNELKIHGLKDYCLDSGYTKSQHFWKKLVGNPEIVITNCWGEGNDYMIWHKKL